MKSFVIGKSPISGEKIEIPTSSFNTHWHLIGGTGKGKTTAITTMLHKLLSDPTKKECYVIVDRMGGFSHQLLMWMASPYCTKRVRDRLIYFEAAREDAVLPINPLLYDTNPHGQFRVARATEIILRGWDSQNIEAMPRLARWVFNCFWSAAQLGLTISDCVHFVLPSSPLHQRLIDCLPASLQMEWADLKKGGGGEVARALDSTRNRLKPYFENDILRRMFGGSQNNLDILRFMKEGKILLVNLAPQNRLSPQVADAIGGIVINEVLSAVRNLPGSVRYPTYLWLDEFQRFVGPDLEEAIPEVRQLGLKLILSHQSLSQLRKGDFDMTPMIFAAQSRMVFGVQGEDADVLAHEFSTIQYDPMALKDTMYSRRQRHAGFKIMELESSSESQSESDSSGSSNATSATDNHSIQHPPTNAEEEDSFRHTYGTGGGFSSSTQSSRSRGTSFSRGRSQTLVPQYEEYLEMTSKSYSTFNEQRTLWAQKIRKLQTGTQLMRVVDNPAIQEVSVDRSAPGFLKYDLQSIHRQFPSAIEATEKLIEQNLQNGPFRSPAEIDQEATARMQSVLNSPARLVPLVEAPADHPFS